MSDFLNTMNNHIISLSEIEEIKLMDFLRTHFEIIEKFIEVHKKANIKLAKKNGKLSGIEVKVYESLARSIKETEEQFQDYKVSGDNLAKYISKIRIEKNCQKQTRKIKHNKNEIETQTPLQAVVSTQVAVTQQQPANNRPQKKNEDELSSVGDQKIDKGFESQPVSRVGNLSTGQVSQAQVINILTEEEENTLLKCSNIYFSYIKLINKIDRDSKLNQNFGVYEEELNMENLVKIIFKVFEIDYFSGNYGILKDGQRRKQKLDNSDVSQKVKKFGAQIWGRMDLIDMLIDRKKRANTPG